MSVAKAWYIRCDSCGDPADISTESAKHARHIARAEGFGRRRVDGRMADLCAACLHAPVNAARQA